MNCPIYFKLGMMIPKIVRYNVDSEATVHFKIVDFFRNYNRFIMAIPMMIKLYVTSKGFVSWWCRFLFGNSGFDSYLATVVSIHI